MEQLLQKIGRTHKHRYKMKVQTLDAFQVIADPSRRQMLMMLSKNSMTINAIAENFDMSRPAVSKHIKVML